MLTRKKRTRRTRIVRSPASSPVAVGAPLAGGARVRICGNDREKEIQPGSGRGC